MLLRPFLFVVLVFCFSAAPGAWAHRLEPISTRFARPFAPRTGSLQVNYEFERRPREGVRTHGIPELEFELGIASRIQFSVEAPLIREKAAGQPATISRGHVEFSLRYLLLGGLQKSYAISINPFVKTPAGNRRVAGGGAEAGLAVHLDKEFGKRAFFHGNYGSSRTFGGSEESERVFRYNSAFVLPFTSRWNPAVELLGETNTVSGRTELVIQPEVIYYVSPHWELKIGLPVGLTRSSPSIGVHAQVAWIYGRGGSK